MGRSSELDGLTTLPELLNRSIETYADREALRQYDRKANLWKSVSYRELGDEVARWRHAWQASGFARGDRVAILMPNGVDTVCADQGALANGLVPVPLHAIDTPGACAFILIDSQATALVTNKVARWRQILNTGVDLPDLRLVIVTDPDPHEEIQSHEPVEIVTLEDWLAREAQTEELPAGPLEDDLAGIVYTSGTTGRPKGVMLTHKNIVSNVKATLECVSPRDGDIFLSFLPLSHTFERSAGYYLPLATGCTIVYNRSILLLAEDLKTVRPTVIISVPRVYERIYARVQNTLAKASAAVRYLFDWAVEVGWRDFCKKNRMPVERSGRAWLDGFVRGFLMRKVASTLLSQFGGRLRIAISGGAALNPKIARTFCGLGLPIIQGYGMTETSPIIAGNSVEFNQPDTVGKPFNNLDVRLGEGGEIQVRGPSVMKGYWRRPDDTATAFTKDGWLRTGDVGEFTPEGLLKIKGRIKEIIVTSTGEKVPPADLESAIETDPLFSQTLILGEGRPYISLIAVVDPAEWQRLTDSLGLEPTGEASLASPAAKSAALKRAKAAAANFPNYALPRAIVLTKDPWTIENGLLTPTLKLKRGPLNQRFKKEIEQLYATHG
ncbi:long-chain fatty acid--CoA ligase [Sutterella massiliensis]|uniref:Long-chain fatty acid--CoA ligase n=1 Tax=Sutterella massiliensis TaxID=1816689 RepID=A0ABS2DNT2_9BURK|nr:long-chain fatty acid--CoA ligase [Sutterella massiliensis]MBM6703040.1 long-chain fatty acid--CoA ligase [Sutterella massiliensis]